MKKAFLGIFALICLLIQGCASTEKNVENISLTNAIELSARNIEKILIRVLL